MILLENKSTQLDGLLDKMAEALQLDNSRSERMRQSYEAVKNWIESDEAFFKGYNYDIYPQGSVKISTTVKPLSNEEFDLDIVLHLTSDVYHTPEQVYSELCRRFGEHEKYKSIMQRKNRCVRLCYAGDYHMDILPGVQESLLNIDRLKVPDRNLGTWVSSNPRGYARWFITKANLAKDSIIEKALRAEKLPTDNYKNKKPLQRAVQLLKRYRDVYFQEDPTYKTSSVILTTLAGQLYTGEESIFGTIDNILRIIQEKIIFPERLKIFNPVNQDEDFTDKWDIEPKYYEAFKKFISHLHEEWQKLKIDNGIIEESSILKRVFGNDVFLKAHTMQTEELETLRKKGGIGIIRSSGIIAATSSQVSPTKENTFYGD